MSDTEFVAKLQQYPEGLVKAFKQAREFGQLDAAFLAEKIETYVPMAGAPASPEEQTEAEAHQRGADVVAGFERGSGVRAVVAEYIATVLDAVVAANLQ